MQVRQPAIAGSFYPASAVALNAMLDDCWRKRVTLDVAVPKAMIAPHAGLVYSGPIAATAYATLAQRASQITRVVLLGPSHHFGFEGFAVPAVDAWATPLGIVRLDRQALGALATRTDVATSDQAHAPEHSLEVHLPFLQRTLPNFSLVPVAVGRTTPDAGAELLAQLWGGDETLIVISSDLSHFFEQQVAQAVDAQTTAVIESLDADAVLNADACGRYPIAGLLAEAKRRQMTMRTVDTRTSADTAGDPSRVVGYGSYLFWPESS
jgi:MEMO1 family protein